MQIAETSFGELSDDQILQLLAERKQLSELRIQYEQAQKEQQEKVRKEKEKTHVQGELARLNALISPDKPDDELIALIEERKIWEAKWKAVTGDDVPPAEEVNTPMDLGAPVDDILEEKNVVVSEASSEGVKEEPSSEGEDKDGFGEQKIVESELDPNSELGQALNRIQNDPESLGKVLDDVSADGKRNKVFMLAVAAVDPAYAMHYADKDVLKKDEDFNLKVVMTKGAHSTGSVLAEMLPDARTAKVVMAAVKQDYRNIRYALPQMDGYDVMLEKAKKAALEKIKELKEGVDVLFLVPKILQKDKTFMKKVEEFIPKEE